MVNRKFFFFTISSGTNDLKLYDEFSPVENQNDLELNFKVFFCVDSCC